MLFFPMQQELDCISDSGDIVGKIRFDDVQRKHVFYRLEGAKALSSADESAISERLAGLDSGQYGIPMQDDD